MATKGLKKQNREGVKMETSTKIWNVDMRNCFPNPNQKREDYGTESEQAWLTNSIDQYGVVQVCWGYRSKENREHFILIEGNRRLHSAQPLIKAGKLITCDIRIVPQHYTKADILKLQVTLNSGKRYKAYENAKVVLSLVEENGYTMQQIREEFNWTPQYTESMFVYNNASSKVQNYVKSGRLSMHYLWELWKENKKDYVLLEATLEKVVSKMDEEKRIKEAQKKNKKGMEMEFPEETVTPAPPANDEQEDAEDSNDDSADPIDLEEPWDELIDQAAKLVIEENNGTASLIQRKLNLGYNRAGKIIDQLEQLGVVGPFQGAKARAVLYPDYATYEKNRIPPADRQHTELNELTPKFTPPHTEGKSHFEGARKKREPSDKITKKKVDAASNKVNSFTALWKFMEENDSEQMKQHLTDDGHRLWQFAEDLRENRITPEMLPKIFFGEQAG